VNHKKVGQAVEAVKLHIMRLSLFVMILFLFMDAFPQEYFQQEVNYKIQVTLNDKSHELNSSESVEYINNSADTLRFIYFHLWPNGYSSTNTALANQLSGSKGKERLFNDRELKGYIDSIDFKVGSKRIQWHLLPGQLDI
jgi:hypothetical protein